MSDQPVRVRFAPSPTGYLHVGGVRTFLFNWLFARHHGGQMVLRIEDTDQQRSTRESEELVLGDLKRLKLNYEEGPDVGGPHSPYRQSERFHIYAKHAQQLLDEDKAYFCFCPPTLIAQKREAALKLGKTPIYDGTCARIPKEKAIERMKAGETASLRFRVPGKSFVLKDLVRGDINFAADTIGDFLITRSPGDRGPEIAPFIGTPVYNFSCVIDDHLMEMSHVIRGEDHISNTSRQLMLYDAFGWTPPLFAHSAMVLGGDRQKLSKRSGDVSSHEYLAKGYLPEALINFLVLLGWWPPQGFQPKSGHPEILSVEELVEVFSIEGLQKSPAVFDIQKLRWMNGFYIKHLPLEEIARRARVYFEEQSWAAEILKTRPAKWYHEVVDIVRGEVQLLSELPEAARLFFESDPQLSEEARAILQDPAASAVVKGFAASAANLREGFSAEDIKALQKEVGKTTQTKGKQLFMPIRAITTGRAHGPDLARVLPLIGKKELLKRIEKIRTQAAL